MRNANESAAVNIGGSIVCSFFSLAAVGVTAAIGGPIAAGTGLMLSIPFLGTGAAFAGKAAFDLYKNGVTGGRANAIASATVAGVGFCAVFLAAAAALSMLGPTAGFIAAGSVMLKASTIFAGLAAGSLTVAAAGGVAKLGSQILRRAQPVAVPAPE